MQGVAAKNDAPCDLSRARASVTGRYLTGEQRRPGVVAGWVFWRAARWGQVNVGAGADVGAPRAAI